MDDKLSIKEITTEESEPRLREKSRRRRNSSRSRSQSMEIEEESVTVVDDGEIVEQQQPPDDPKTKTVTKTTTTTSTKKTTKRTTTPSPHLARKAQMASSEVDGTVRIVPIMLPDGTLLRREPDESVEVKTEFTNYCHQEYPDGEGSDAKDDAAIIKSLLQKASPKPRKEGSQKGDAAEIRPPSTNGTDSSNNRERVVPITLSNGDKFVPTFTKLSDLEPPDWSAFGSPSKNKVKSAGVGTHQQKETVVPIQIDGEQNRPGRSTQRKMTSGPKEGKKEEDSNRAKKSTPIEDDCGKTTFSEKTETREREEGVESTRTKKTLTTTDKTTKRSEQKKVQHTVRFNIDESDKKSHGGGGARSSSLESHFR